MKKIFLAVATALAIVFLFAKGAGDCHYNQSAFH